MNLVWAVGPEASGLCSVASAMRWRLGDRSTRTGCYGTKPRRHEADVSPGTDKYHPAVLDYPTASDIFRLFDDLDRSVTLGGPCPADKRNPRAESASPSTDWPSDWRSNAVNGSDRLLTARGCQRNLVWAKLSESGRKAQRSQMWQEGDVHHRPGAVAPNSSKDLHAPVPDGFGTVHTRSPPARVFPP